MTSSLIWEHVQGNVVESPRGCIVFDDSVLEKNHSHHIDLVRRQYSGNAHGLIKGIGMVNCLYVNPDSGQYWIIDYRIFDPLGMQVQVGSCARDADLGRQHQSAELQSGAGRQLVRDERVDVADPVAWQD